jgi:hypothetical protein
LFFVVVWLNPGSGVRWPARSGWDEATAKRRICSRLGISRPFHGAKPYNDGVNWQKLRFGVGRDLNYD